MRRAQKVRKVAEQRYYWFNEILGPGGEVARCVWPGGVELFSLSTGKRIQLIANARCKDGLPLGPRSLPTKGLPRPARNWLLASVHQ
jgi:hypothetical protein